MIWLVNAAGVEATFHAFALDLPPYASFLVLGTIAVALVLPSAPGYVGPFQVGDGRGPGPRRGPARDGAVAVDRVPPGELHPDHLVGLAYLSALNLTLGDLRAASEKSA